MTKNHDRVLAEKTIEILESRKLLSKDMLQKYGEDLLNGKMTEEKWKTLSRAACYNVRDGV
jgi:hypothetical protein